MNRLVYALNAYRIERGLTSRQLARELDEAKCPIPQRTVYQLCRDGRYSTPREPTLALIEKFLLARRYHAPDPETIRQIKENRHATMRRVAV